MELPKDAQYKCFRVLDPNFGEFQTGVRQYLFQAFDDDKDCVEPFKLTRSDEQKTEVVVDIKVMRGSCPPTETDCPKGEIQNLDFASTTACTCQPLHPAEGRIIDLSETDAIDF